MNVPARPSPTNLELFDAPASIRMRFARPSDADYIYGLRTDSAYNTHLSPPPPSAAAQREFLEKYLAREAAGTEFYFVVENRKTGRPCGVVRVYDLQEDTFCWGSWILDHTKPRFAAVESALFIYDFAFGALGYRFCHFDVRRGNKAVIAFHERFGAVRTNEDDLNIHFRLSLTNLREKLPALVALCGYVPLHLPS